VTTARKAGLDSKKNGELLAAASTSFDVLITVDGSLSEQQSKAVPLPVILMIGITSRIEHLAPLAPEVLKLLSQPLQKRLYIVDGRPRP
jgi:hypothetical protein